MQILGIKDKDEVAPIEMANKSWMKSLLEKVSKDIITKSVLPDNEAPDSCRDKSDTEKKSSANIGKRLLTCLISVLKVEGIQGAYTERISDRVAAIDMMLFKNSTEPISVHESHWNPLKETTRGIMLSIDSPDRPISLSQGGAIPLTPECDNVVYMPRVTQTPWRQSSLNSKMKQELAKTFNLKKSQVNLDFLKQNIIHLIVYFDDFTTESISEQPQYTIESLMCDFGGLMGLLIGASTISIVEIVYICAQMLLNKKAKRTGSIETTENELQHHK
eukprot:gene4035-biopygen2513